MQLRKKLKASRDPKLAHFMGMGWISVILKGQMPESRCNMGYCTDGIYFYILGGQDLNTGLKSSLWRINMATVRDNIKNAGWEEVTCRGDPMKNVSHCCIFAHQSKIFVFGGAHDEHETKKNSTTKKRMENLDNAGKGHMFHVLNL